MAKEIRNLGASIRARLLSLSKSTQQPFDVLLTRFVLERLLYRLSRSAHAGAFVLKGAMLLATWQPNPHRGTRDLDLLGFGSNEAGAMLQVFRDILGAPEEDGVTFDVAALRVDAIREELEYGGLRLRTNATVGGARISVVVDVGFGDATEPGLELIDYPALLDFPRPRIRAYARETVIAEKFQAMDAARLRSHPSRRMHLPPLSPRMRASRRNGAPSSLTWPPIQVPLTRYVLISRNS